VEEKLGLCLVHSKSGHEGSKFGGHAILVDLGFDPVQAGISSLDVMLSGFLAGFHSVHGLDEFDEELSI
jgi:hypothetical protein